MRISDWSSDVCSSDLKDIADEATNAVSYQFMQGQDGYRFLHDWIKAGLLEKTSTAKVCVEQVPPKRREETVPAEALSLLMEQGAEIIAASPADETEPRSEERRVGKAGGRTCRYRGSTHH